MPASIAGALILVALIPGYFALTLTSRHRLPNHRPSALEEAASLVAVGLSTSGLATAAVAYIRSDSVSTLLNTHTGHWSGERVRLALVLAALTFGTAMFIAWFGSFVYLKRTNVRSSESGWHDALSDGGIVQVALLDGTTVRAPLYSYDGISHGNGRDLVLKAPIHAFSATRQPEPVDVDWLVINETQIHSLAVQKPGVSDAS